MAGEFGRGFDRGVALVESIQQGAREKKRLELSQAMHGLQQQKLARELELAKAERDKYNSAISALGNFQNTAKAFPQKYDAATSEGFENLRNLRSQFMPQIAASPKVAAREEAWWNTLKEQEGSRLVGRLNEYKDAKALAAARLQVENEDANLKLAQEASVVDPNRTYDPNNPSDVAEAKAFLEGKKRQDELNAAVKKQDRLKALELQYIAPEAKAKASAEDEVSFMNWQRTNPHFRNAKFGDSLAMTEFRTETQGQPLLDEAAKLGQEGLKLLATLTPLPEGGYSPETVARFKASLADLDRKIKAGEKQAVGPKTEFQSKAFMLSERAYFNDKTLSSLEAKAVRGTAKFWTNLLAKMRTEEDSSEIQKFVLNTFTDPDDQRYISAAISMSMAILRQESGAAITNKEIAGKISELVPQPGDSEAAIRDKRVRRQQTIESIRMAANVDPVDANGAIQFWEFGKESRTQPFIDRISFGDKAAAQRALKEGSLKPGDKIQFANPDGTWQRMTVKEQGGDTGMATPAPFVPDENAPLLPRPEMKGPPNQEPQPQAQPNEVQPAPIPMMGEGLDMTTGMGPLQTGPAAIPSPAYQTGGSVATKQVGATSVGQLTPLGGATASIPVAQPAPLQGVQFQEPTLPPAVPPPIPSPAMQQGGGQPFIPAPVEGAPVAPVPRKPGLTPLLSEQEIDGAPAPDESKQFMRDFIRRAQSMLGQDVGVGGKRGRVVEVYADGAMVDVDGRKQLVPWTEIED
tara:strand:- start:4110 stop:6353 length:2244 start_codon:yes stop_codon:yes gene_type:complete